MTERPRIEFSEYALLRMRQRDILLEEAREILELPRSRHKRRADGRSEVRGQVGKRTLLVVYRQAGDIIVVINAMWE
jgi:hypothetical protein